MTNDRPTISRRNWSPMQARNNLEYCHYLSSFSMVHHTNYLNTSRQGPRTQSQSRRRTQGKVRCQTSGHEQRAIVRSCRFSYQRCWNEVQELASSTLWSGRTTSRSKPRGRCNRLPVATCVAQLAKYEQPKLAAHLHLKLILIHRNSHTFIVRYNSNCITCIIVIFALVLPENVCPTIALLIGQM